MLCRALVIALSLTIPTAGFAPPSSAKQALEGVWKIVELTTTGANASTISNPQPSLIIFTKGHYSYLSINSDGPRPQFAPPKDPRNLTDAEKIARYEQWNPFTANAGTYEVKGTTIIRHPVVAKNETVMAGSSSLESQFKLEGNTLWAVTKAAAGMPAGETRVKLKRIE